MSDTERKDVYIAVGIGGLALILIMLYIYGGKSVPVTDQTNSDGASLPSVTATPPPDTTPYTYNIQPYYPNAGLPLAANANKTSNGKSGCGGCSSKSSCYNPSSYGCTIAQFNTLAGYGNEAGA